MAIPKGNNEGAVTGAETQSLRGDTPPKANYDQIADYLTDGFWEWAGGSRYAFDVAPGGTLTADITNLTAGGQQLARWALEAWTNVTDIDFRFVESDADITFDDEEAGGYSTSNSSGNQIISSFVNVSKDWVDAYGSTIDSFNFSTYIHEIGHALGLGHPGPYNAFGDYGVDNIFPGDSWQATVMSYFSQTENTYINASIAHVVTPMIADIIAIQNLYGVPTDINAGDTVYGYQSNLDGYLGQLFALGTGEGNDPKVYRGEDVTLTLYDTGGRDTLDLRVDTNDQWVDLRPEGISDVYGLVGNLSIARDTLIEDFIAGSGNDRVIGNAVANRLAGGAGNDELWGSGGDDVLEGGGDNDVLEGGAGADRLLGGAGMDTVSYSGSDEAVTVDLETGTVAGGHAKGDVIMDVENVMGSGHGDMLKGDSGANQLSGSGGGDVLEGRAGADRLDGGLGADTVSYSGSEEAVTVDLEAGTGKRGHAEGDVIVDVENVLGSGYGDALEGDGGVNRLSGAGGNDKLSGRGGDDALAGGAGADRLDGGAGMDTVSYSGSDGAVTVDLKAGTGKRGHAEGDVIVDVENVLGSGYGDVLGGDSDANRLSGAGGNDRLLGRGGDDVLEGGAGADRLFGGGGMDTVSYSGSDGAVTVDLETGTGKRGHAEGDVIADVENVVGSGYGDVLGGDDGDNRLSGGDGDDVLDGGLGADRLYGGVGVDTVSYSGSDEAVTVYLWKGAGEGGHAEGDVIVDVENVIGSDYGDVLGGDAGANRLDGGAGTDTVSYSGSDEAVTVDLEAGTGEGGHAESDVIVNIENVTGSGYGDALGGDSGANRLSGRDGDDVLEGGAGADWLLGGAGVDTASYAGSNRGVTVYLWKGTGEGGHAEGDVIVDVENVLGSGYRDVLGGDGGVNRLSGAGGNDRLLGRGGDDVLEGGAGADRLLGGAGVDTASYSGSNEAVTVDLEAGTVAGGHAEGDVIMNIENVTGSGHGDVLGGDDGDNRLFGAGGNDRLSGRAGDDVLAGGAGADRLLGGAGTDTVSYSGSNEAVTVDLEAGTVAGGHAEGDVIVDVENMIGSGYGDMLGGDASVNRLDGGDGDDVLRGGGGDDVLDGGADSDRLFGGAGKDELWGKNGGDWLDGGAGADRLFGGAGADWVAYSGSDEAVTVDLGEGTVAGGHAEGDVIVDVENVMGSGYGDVLGGDNGSNRLSGGDGNDRLSGRGGDDVLEGGAGADRLDGGLGVDTVSYSGSDEAVTVHLETDKGGEGHAEGDVITGIENIVGSGYGDILTGDDGANRLDGGAGDDFISSGASDDSLWGGAGNDWLEGDVGADQLSGGAGMDTVDYSGSDGAVTVKLWAGTGEGSYAEGDVIVDVEDVIGSEYGDVLEGDDGSNQLSGRGGADKLRGGGGDDLLWGHDDDDSLWGGGGNDFLWGDAGADELWGDVGDDWMDGGAGADQLNGGAGVDTVDYWDSDGAVTVKLWAGTGEGGHAEGDVIVNVESVIGSEYGDVLEGDDGSNHLSGHAGADELRGRAGDDFLLGYDGDDSLWGGAGDDFLSSHAGDDSLWGDAGNDFLSGHAGDDTLWGGAGDDWLDGGAGADQLNGGAGMDTVDYWDSKGAVTVKLWAGTGEGSYAEGDVIADVENVVGSEHGDVLEGDDGDNQLSGGGGNDRLSGRGGNDIFRFDFGQGDDIITDFTDGEDLIDLNIFDLSSFDDLVISSDSDGVTIDLVAYGGGTIRLEGFDIADLDAGDFLS